jgi:lysophospholipase L1-like esterase
MNAIRCCTLAFVVSCVGSAPAADEHPYWLNAMQEVHAKFRGTPGYVAQFGDSITHSMAFWTPIGWDDPDQYLTRDDGLPKRPANARWRDTIKGTRNKGGEHGNYSGWRVGNLLEAIPKVLEREKPEAAIIMIGTNDISGGKVPNDYQAGLEKVVDKCLAAHCVPILNTIPPRRDRADAVSEANRIVREVAKQKKVPLVDYHAECLRLRPGETWKGTIIADDGVHPTGGKTNVYTEENVKESGYALRNWLNFLAVREVYFRVLAKNDSAD